MGLGRIKRPKKEWISFWMLEDMLEELKMKNVEFCEVAGIPKGTYYTWKKKNKCPAYALAAVRIGIMQHYCEDFTKKTKILFKEDEI